jgi:cytosine/adenosine deaminase-related metal-dependent hydrolase
MIRLYKNGRVLGESREILPAKILTQNETILGIFKPEEPIDKTPEVEIDLDNQIVFPGLINSHDHLYYSFWPKFGGEKAYQCWSEWEEEFRNSPQNRKKQALSVSDLYMLGMYRNLLSGVTLIVDHFPKEVVANFFGSPLVSFLENFALAHSPAGNAMAWGSGLAREYKETKGVVPFILHVKDGPSDELSDEIETLERQGALNTNTVLFSGVGLSDDDLALIARRGASIVFCLSANQFLFRKTPPLARVMDLNIRFAFGTDGVLTGGLNLLEELRFIRACFDRELPGRMSLLELVERVTIHPAAMFRVEKQYGSIAPGRFADFFVFPDRKNDPLESFLALTPAEVSLVVHRGMSVYGDEKFRRFCACDFSRYSEILVSGVPKMIWGKPLFMLERIKDKLEEPIRFPFLPISEA